jgi:hypothetical protein
MSTNSKKPMVTSRTAQHSAVMAIVAALSLSDCAQMGAAARKGDVTYLQLSFVQTASECRARQAAIAQRLPSARPKSTATCFVRAITGGGLGPEPQLPAYVLEVVSTGSLQKSDGDSAVTVTYQSLGPLHLAKEEAGTNSQPLGTGEAMRYQMLVFSSPTAGQQAEYNKWYEALHVPDVLRVPGFISGRRFLSLDPEQRPLGLPPYLVEFELGSGDLKVTSQDIGARIRDGRTRMSPSFDGTTVKGLFITPID